MGERRKINIRPASEYGSTLPDGVSADIAILAGIGGVCLQWARLEMAALAVIGAFEGQETEETWLRYGGLDLLPRINLAIRLAEKPGKPAHFAKRIRSARRKLQGRQGLSEKRNEVVHGAHRSLDGQTATLTMTRYPEGNREIQVDPFSLNSLSREIHALANDVWELFQDIWEWNVRQAK